MDLSREEIQAILEAREAKEKDAQTRGAEQLAQLLSTPQSGNSRKFTLTMADEADGGDGTD
jgi:hypothetical protein